MKQKHKIKMFMKVNITQNTKIKNKHKKTFLKQNHKKTNKSALKQKKNGLKALDW